MYQQIHTWLSRLSLAVLLALTGLLWQWAVAEKREALLFDDVRSARHLAAGSAGRSWRFPVESRTTADIISFHGDPRAGGRRSHEGVDIPAPRGTAVLAATDGRVHRVHDGGNGGKQIWLRTHGGRELHYAHLHEQYVREGQSVKAGQVIGAVGNTGNARHTLPHLHFGVFTPDRRSVDPLPFFQPAERP